MNEKGDIIGLREELSKIQTKKEAQTFLEKLSIDLPLLIEAQHSSTADYLSAISAVLLELPSISDEMEDKDAKIVCSVLFAALFYQ